MVGTIEISNQYLGMYLKYHNQIRYFESIRFTAEYELTNREMEMEIRFKKYIIFSNGGNFLKRPFIVIK